MQCCSIFCFMDGLADHNRLYDCWKLCGIQGMLCMDYILVSLALACCLVLWWSFLAVSGLMRFKLCERRAFSVLSKNEWPGGSPFLLQGAARQHLAVNGFDIGCLHCRDIDPALTYHYYVVRRLRRADSDREHERTFTGGGDALVAGARADVLFHLGSDLEGPRIGGHLG